MAGGLRLPLVLAEVGLLCGGGPGGFLQAGQPSQGQAVQGVPGSHHHLLPADVEQKLGEGRARLVHEYIRLGHEVLERDGGRVVGGDRVAPLGPVPHVQGRAPGRQQQQHGQRPRRHGNLIERQSAGVGRVRRGASSWYSNRTTCFLTTLVTS